MSDILMSLNRNRAIAPIVKALGLPNPVPLARAEGGYEAQPFAGKMVILGRSENGYAAEHLQAALENGSASLSDSGDNIDIFVLDATGCRAPSDYRVLYDSFHPVMRRIARNGRVFIAAPLPDEADGPVASAVARGIEGFSRALGKELGKKGICVNLAYVARDAVSRLEGPVRFFCGKQTTYVSGQAVRVTSLAAKPDVLPWTQALKGKVALVTGSGRGIGMATAERLAQEGAQVVCLDIPSASDALHDTCIRIGAIPLVMDIAEADAPRRIAAFFKDRFGGLDIVVHNAGVTRDRTLANMKEHYWDMVVNVNLAAIAAIDDVLLSQQVLRDEGRIVCLSSISGISGNIGQTNYAASKAALIGYVAALAPQAAARAICANAVAPGFIETAMTDAMPFIPREVGRRLNSLLQGGKPRDAAELIAFLCTPGAFGISGQTIRVCGQGLMGA
ncbi:3-oxoacyl-ACP reductase [Noviherbaspirillum sp.]|uniref:3-oxoacyl-ACP reductase n=1 Tax=Noviherbaspirillum sp. TaxID=1926288 RepID=UPI002D4A9675|nr:3-oxoacyl-ACP reductase [Noviherbaspirillum sp.]HZW22150.1 3-oxoacyl-ACP reductase [Noviherbaspirillum sp.]